MLPSAMIFFCVEIVPLLQYVDGLIDYLDMLVTLLELLGSRSGG